MYNSKGQGVKLYTPSHLPLEGARVIFSTIDNQKSIFYYSDNLGEVRSPQIGFPMVRKVISTGFEYHIDTLTEAKNELQVIYLSPLQKNLDEVTVTGTLLPQYQSNSVYSIQVINREEIEHKAANNLRELLSSELNLKIANDAILGSSLSIQGNGGENIKFLIDGVPVVGRQNGNIDLNSLNLSNIDRVEIIKGPMSVLYGTDALAGVVNLISKTNAKQNLSVGLNSYYESNGQYNADASLGWGFRKSSLMISGGRNFFDGWNEDETTRNQLWKPKEQFFGNIKFNSVIKNWKWNIQSDFNKDKITDKGTPIVTPYSAKAFDNYFTTLRSNSQFSMNKSFSELSAIQLTGAYSYYQHIKNSYVKNMVDLTEQLINGQLDNDTTTFNSAFARLNYSNDKIFDKVALLGGIDYNFESAKGSRIDNNNHDNIDYALFASIEYKPISILSIRPAVRAIYNTNYDAPLIPSVNLLYKPFKFYEIRLSWSKGFRAPSLKEQFLDFEDSNHNVHGNPNLKAENSTHYLASLLYKKVWKKVVFMAEPSVFYSQIENRISLVEADATTKLYQYTNIENFNSKGAELTLKCNLSRFHLSAGTSYTGVHESFGATSKQTDIAWFPEYNASVDYTFSKFKTTFSAQWKGVGKKPVYRINTDESISRFENDSYQLLDVNVRQQFYKNHFNITLGIKNILNVKQVNAYESSGVHSDGSNETSIGTGTTCFVKIGIAL